MTKKWLATVGIVLVAVLVVYSAGYYYGSSDNLTGYGFFSKISGLFEKQKVQPTKLQQVTIQKRPMCGNGVLETNEYCDDGNRVGGDGCSVKCRGEYLLQEKKEPVDSISSKLKLIKKLTDICTAYSFQEDCSILKAEEKKYLEIKNKIGIATNSKVLSNALHDLSHESDFQLTKLNAKFTLPETSVALQIKLSALKGGLKGKVSGLDLQKISNLEVRLLDLNNQIMSMPEKERFGTGSRTIAQFVTDNRKNFEDAKLVIMRFQDDIAIKPPIDESIRLISLIKISSTTLATTSPPEWEPLGPDTARVLFLYGHWANPFDISDRTGVDRVLGETTAAFREFSYNNFEPQFDVCEVDVPFERPATGLESAQVLVDLCDPTVDYRIYDWLIFYPLGGSGILGYGPDLTSDEGDLTGKNTLSHETTVLTRVILMHEGGHALRLKHADSFECGEVVIGESCERIRQGNVFDTMGAGGGGTHYNCAYKEQLGWITAYTEISFPGVYNITALEVNTTDSQCLKIDESLLADTNFAACNGDLYFEYRKPIGSDSRQLTSNLMEDYYPSADGFIALQCVRQGTESVVHSFLLDTTPNSLKGYIVAVADIDVIDGLLTAGREVRIVSNSGSADSDYVISFENLPDNKARLSIRSVFSPSPITNRSNIP